MAHSRLPSGPYKKVLVRIPCDILEQLQQEGLREERSVNGQLVYTLRQIFPRTAAPAHEGEPQPTP